MCDDNILLSGICAAYLVIRNSRKKRTKRKFWIRGYYNNRSNVIMRELREDKDILFKNFTRMSEKNFDRLLKLVTPIITKQSTQLREAIPSEIKLAITLRFLATGDNLMSLSYLFKVSKQFISAMLPDVLKAIIKVLKDYIKVRKSFIYILYI